MRRPHCATSDTTQRAQYVTQYNAVISQINTMASDSGYRGTNLLVSNTMTVKFNEDGASSLSIEGFKATATGLTVGIVGQATGGIAASWSDTTNGTLSINSALTQLSDALSTLRVKSSSLSSSLSIVQTRADWADQMVATLQSRCRRVDRCRHERRGCEHAYAADPAVSGYDSIEPVGTERPVGPAALLTRITTRIASAGGGSDPSSHSLATR